MNPTEAERITAEHTSSSIKDLAHHDADYQSARILICSKSAWDPPIRREHALAVAAAQSGIEVDFVERASDVRMIRSDRAWLRRAGGSKGQAFTAGAVRVTPRRTFVPGHRSRMASTFENALLRRLLASAVNDRHPADAVVVNAPWNWSATSQLRPGVRRVLDLADDWRTLMPQRRALVESWYRRIEDEADEIIVVSARLAKLFSRPVTVVPNAVAPALLQTAPKPAAGNRRMAYVGTLSERFDAGLIAGALTKLDGWTLDLYGPTLYGPGGSGALDRLCAGFAGRVNLRGVLGRDEMSDVLDDVDVAVIANDPTISVGQDSMKLYDYAARARPVVAAGLPPLVEGPPGLIHADTPEDFAAAVERAATLDSAENRSWAEQNTWDRRCASWLAQVLGSRTPPWTTP